MLRQLPYKSKQFFIAIIKLSIIVGVGYYIYNRLTKNSQLNFFEFHSFLTNNAVFSIKNILFLIILSIFNWFFEILKWKILVNTIKKISFLDALEQSLGGLTASLITPNRIGDYGAKAIYYPPTQRKKIILLNLLSNMSQMCITTIFGLTGFIIFYTTYNLDIDFLRVSQFFVIIIIVSAFSFFGWQQSKFKIKGILINKVIDFVKSISVKTHINNLSFSFFRYCIFSFQFYFLLHIFGETLDYKTAIATISSMYLLASIIPSLAIFDVLIKTGAAVFLFGILGIDELTILTISTLMWLLNFILPAIFGSYFVLNFKLPKSED